MSLTSAQITTVKKTVLNPISLNVPNGGGTAYTYVNIFKIKGVVAINSIMFKNETFTSNPIPSTPYPWVDFSTASTGLGNINNFSFKPVLRSAGSIIPLTTPTSLLNYFKPNTTSSSTTPDRQNVINPISQGHYIILGVTGQLPLNLLGQQTLPVNGFQISSAAYLSPSPITDYYRIDLTGIGFPGFSQWDVVTQDFGVVSAATIAYNSGGGYILTRLPSGTGFTIGDAITANGSQYTDGSLIPSNTNAIITAITPITAVGQGQLLDGTTTVVGTVFEADSNNDTYWSLEFLYNTNGLLGAWNPWIGTYTPTIYWTPISADADILQP